MANATWSFLASSGADNYNNSGDWDSFVVPGMGDTAFFGPSNVTVVTVNNVSTDYIDAWVFIPGSSQYSFALGPDAYANPAIRFFGDGVVDNGVRVNIGVQFHSEIEFHNNSSAGGTSVTYNSSGALVFEDVSTGGSANITNNGTVAFDQGSSAGASSIRTLAGAVTEFSNLTNGGSAQFTTDAGGTVDFSEAAGPANNNALTVGSIAGPGAYYLGGDQLTVGANGPSKIVSGPIDDGTSPALGGGGHTGGSLVKVGQDQLTLSGANNTYSGGTTIEQGMLDLDAIGAAGTGAIAFAGRATLRVENVALSGHVFANPIDFFGRHDVIDLTGLRFHAGATARYHAANDILRVHSGHITDVLTLLSPQGTHFHTASDHHGGTDVFLVFA
jgi:autotransporter-associated beta strand protein